MRSRWGAKINQYSEPPKLQSPLKPESGSWQNSWWIGLMSEEWNKTQHMSEPEVLGLCVIVPRWMPCVHLEGAAALLHSQPHKVTFKNYCRTIKRFDCKMYFSSVCFFLLCIAAFMQAAERTVRHPTENIWELGIDKTCSDTLTRSDKRSDTNAISFKWQHLV